MIWTDPAAPVAPALNCAAEPAPPPPALLPGPVTKSPARVLAHEVPAVPPKDELLESIAEAPPAPERKPPPPPPPPPISAVLAGVCPVPPTAPGAQDAAEFGVNEGLPPLALAMRLLVLPPAPPEPAAIKSVTPLRTSELAPPPPAPPPENPAHPVPPPGPPAGGPDPPAPWPSVATLQLPELVMPPNPPCPTTADKTSFMATFNTAVYSVALPPFPPGPLSMPPPPPAPPFIFTIILVTPAGTVKVEPDVMFVVDACASPRACQQSQGQRGSRRARA